jgi:hypothetical protein
MVVRRRLPEVLFAGEPALAAWGLWRGLVEPSFELRYRCGAVLSRLASSGRLAPVTSETAFEAVRRELITDPIAWKNQRVAEDPLIASAHDGGQRDEAMVSHAGSALEHVFTVLGLALPVEPLRIALHAVQTDDSALRETALEYLESILPTDVRIQLWPLLEADSTTRAAGVVADTPTPVRNPRSRDELVAALNLAYPTIRASLLDKRSPRPFPQPISAESSPAGDVHGHLHDEEQERCPAECDEDEARVAYERRIPSLRAKGHASDEGSNDADDDVGQHARATAADHL